MRIVCWRLMFLLCLLSAASLIAGSAARTPSFSAAIMARVAANQDRSNKLRASYIYHQRIHVTSRKTSGKLMCEETTEYLVIPSAQGTKRQIKHVTGRYWHKGRYLNFDQRPGRHKGGDVNVQWPDNATVDCQVADQLGNNLTDDQSKDGIDRDLFPLTTAQQKGCQFRLIGEENLAGRRVYRVRFKPKDKGGFTWAGEADIDAQDFEPVDVYTSMSRQIPRLIRTFIVALPGLGFDVQYQRQLDGIWFPTSFGTEFRLRLFIFYRREYTISLENTGFTHTHVTIKMQYLGPVSPK
jgi:hypothetical protein